MKKFFSLVLALVMALSLTTVAWGADITSTATTGAALQAEIDAATAGDTITLTSDISADAIITINKAITLDGDGHTLTSTAGRAINIETTGTVEIKNLTVNASGERAFNVINQPATLKLTNVTATAANYAVNIAGTAGAAKVTITDSTLTGLNTVNVAGAGAVVTISGGKIVCDDQSNTESYGALSLNSVATGATITASGTDFDIKDNSVLAINPATDAVITIDGSDSGVAVMVAEIKYGAYSYVFPTVQDAIDHAVNKDGASETTPVEIIVLPAAVNSGESFTPAAGVTVTMPAGAEMVDDGTGNLTVAPTGTSAGGVATKLYVADAAATNGWKLVSSFPGADLDDFAKDASDKCLPCYEVNGDYYVEVKAAAASYKLVYGAKTVYLTPVAAKLVKYVDTASVLKVVDAEDAVCGDFYVANLDEDDVYYVSYNKKGTAVDGTWVAAKNGSVQILVNGKIVNVEALTVPQLGHDWKGYDAANGVYTSVKCANCDKVAALYANATAAGKKSVNVPGFGWITEAAAGYTASAGTTSSTVTSAQTFDAGIAMYVGMSVMAAAGSAVVIGKKKD